MTINNCFLVSGNTTVNKKAVEEFALIYKGEAIAKGTKADFQKQIKEIGKNIHNEKRLVQTLDDLLKQNIFLKYADKFEVKFQNHFDGEILIKQKGKEEIIELFGAHNHELRKLGYINKKPHAEELGFDWLKKQGIKNDKVVKIYSELEPCMLCDHKCKQQIAKKFPDAKVSYSYSFTKHPKVMKKAIEERAKDLNKIIKN